MSVKKFLSLNRERRKPTTLAAVKKVLSFNNVAMMIDKAASGKAIKKKRKTLSLDNVATMDKEEPEALAMKEIEKERRHSSIKWLTFSREIKIEPSSAGSLKEVDSKKLKAEIIRWAKAVAVYARQISGRRFRSSSSV